MTIKYDFIQSNYYLVKEKKKNPKAMPTISA